MTEERRDGGVSGPRAGGPSGPRAGFWARFVAYLVDLVVITAPVAALVTVTDGALTQVAAFACFVAYFTALEAAPRGQTLGKRVLRIRVVGLSTGEPVERGRAVLRAIGKPISSIFYLGYIWMLFDDERQTWHDKMAGSVVVPAAPGRAGPEA
jgi:uncharacterized RDD family membrane protein YckC